MKEEQYNKARAKLEYIRLKGPHPWGKGGFTDESPGEIVAHAEREGYSDKRIAGMLGLQYGIRGGAKGGEMAEKIHSAENMARKKAHEKGEYKGDRIRV
jgi:hypothetical protein